MGAFIPLGLKGTNKVIDQHFEKLPDRFFHPDHPVQKVVARVNPLNLSKSHRRKRYAGFYDDQSDSEGDREEKEEEGFESADEIEREEEERGDMELQRTSRELTRPVLLETTNLPPRYSREPPHVRPQYTPTARRVDVEPAEPPGLARARAEYERNMKARRDWDENYYSESSRVSKPQRPRAVTRRSSSHPARHRRREESSESSDGNSSEMRRRDKARDKAHRYGLKDETLGRFGTTPASVTGGVFGALVGGWAAQKAQVAAGKDNNGERKREKATNNAITLLGAAVGGLAVNAAMEKWQKGREEGNEKQDKWEKKFGREGGDGRRDSGSRSERRDSGQGQRRSGRDHRGRDQSDEDSDDGRSSRRGGGSQRGSEVGRRDREREYRGERDGRGYQPYGE